jgi:hypothetical protein
MRRQQPLCAVQVTLRLNGAILSSLNPNSAKAEFNEVVWMGTAKDGISNTSKL